MIFNKTCKVLKVFKGKRTSLASSPGVGQFVMSLKSPDWKTERGKETHQQRSGVF